LAQRSGITVSVTTVCRLFKRHRVRWGRPKPIVGCPWTKARRMRRLRQIRKLVRNMRRNEVAVYVDEVDMHLNPKIGPDWMLCGQQKKVLTPGKNQKRYLAGALDAHTAGSRGWKPIARPAICSSSYCGNCYKSIRKPSAFM
jgi:putative transposase